MIADDTIAELVVAAWIVGLLMGVFGAGYCFGRAHEISKNLRWLEEWMRRSEK